jgi:hypothetical protein
VSRLLLVQIQFVINHYRTGQHGEDAPETADLYFSYGKALLENAISQSSVLGRGQVEEDMEGITANGDFLLLFYLAMRNT